MLSISDLVFQIRPKLDTDLNVFYKSINMTFHMASTYHFTVIFNYRLKVLTNLYFFRYRRSCSTLLSKFSYMGQQMSRQLSIILESLPIIWPKKNQILPKYWLCHIFVFSIVYLWLVLFCQGSFCITTLRRSWPSNYWLFADFCSWGISNINESRDLMQLLEFPSRNQPWAEIDFVTIT